jgi:glycosyltransferase involved in cell wall biosynthesis
MPEPEWFRMAVMPRHAGDSPVAAYSDAVRQLLASERFDIVHSHNLHVEARTPYCQGVEEVAAEQGIPHVMTVHDVPWFDSIRRVLRPLDRTFLLTLSAFNQRRLWTMIGRRVPLMPICIDFSKFSGGCPEPNTVAFPARLAPHKGGLEAIQAVGAAARDVGPIRLLFSDWRRWSAGQTEEFVARLRQAGADTPGVEIEFLQDPGVVPKIYQRAMLTLVTPKRVEGFGLVPMESLACGCPVIAVPTGGMTEWITGLPGVLIPEGDSEDDLSRAIVHVFERWPEYREGAVAARAILQARYDVGPCVAVHVAFYRQVLETGKQPV